MPLERFSERLAAQFYVLGGGGGSAPAFVDIGTPVEFAATDTFDITYPAAIPDGSHAFLVLCTNSVGAVAVISDIGGFSGAQVATQTKNNLALDLYDVEVGVADSSKMVTIGLAAAVITGVAVVAVWSNTAAAVASFDVSSGTSTSATSPGIFAAADASLVLNFTALSITGATSPPAGYTERADTGSVTRICIDEKQVNTGVEAAATRTVGSCDWACVELSLEHA